MPKNRPIRQTDRDSQVGGAPVIVETLDDPTPPASPSPNPPEDLALATSLYQSAKVSTAQIAATWNPPDNVVPDSYILQWSDDSGFPADNSPSLPVTHVPASAQSGSIAPLKLGVAYYVRVATVKNGRQSLWTDAVSIATGNDPTAPTAPTLTLDFTGRDCIIKASGSGFPSANTKDVQLDIATLGGTPLRTVYINPTTAYIYRLVDNLQDTSQVGAPQLYVTARARSYYDVYSTPASASATNAIPGPVTSVALSSGPAQVIIQITHTQPADFLQYRIRVTKDGSDWLTVYDPRTYISVPASVDGTYRAYVYVQDAYGQESSATTSSSVVCDFFSVAELRTDITYSDSVGNTNFASLKDTITASGGIAYASSASWRWVQAERVTIDRHKVNTVAFSADTPAYIGVSADGTTWLWYSGPLTGNVLTAVADETAAQAAAVNFTTVITDYLLPVVQDIRYVRLGFKAVSGVTLNELYPRRLVQADDIQTDTLSAIVANLGTVTAGTLRGVTVYGGSGDEVRLDSTGVRITATPTDSYSSPHSLSWVDPSDPTRVIFYQYGYTQTAIGSTSGVNRVRLSAPNNSSNQFGSIAMIADAIPGYAGLDGASILVIGGALNAGTRQVGNVTAQANKIALYAQTTEGGYYDATLTLQSGRSGYVSSLNVNAEAITLGYSGVSVSLPGGLNVGSATGAGTGVVKASSDGTFAGGLNVGSATGAATGTIRTSGTAIYLGGQTTYSWYYDSGNTGYRTNGNLLTDANIYWGSGGAWLSSYLNQAVLTSSAPTFAGLTVNAAISRGGTTGYLLVPISGAVHSSYNSAAVNVGTYTVGYSGFSGVPSNAKALQIRISGKWAAATGVAALRYTSGQDGIIVRSQVANITIDSAGAIGLDGSGNFQLVISTTNASNITLMCIGYYI